MPDFKLGECGARDPRVLRELGGELEGAGFEILSAAPGRLELRIPEWPLFLDTGTPLFAAERLTLTQGESLLKIDVPYWTPWRVLNHLVFALVFLPELLRTPRGSVEVGDCLSLALLAQALVIASYLWTSWRARTRLAQARAALHFRERRLAGIREDRSMEN